MAPKYAYLKIWYAQDRSGRMKEQQQLLLLCSIIIIIIIVIYHYHRHLLTAE
jgi:hypothetical protein